MVAVIVAAHGHLAEGLIASSAIITGPQENLVAITFDCTFHLLLNINEELREELKQMRKMNMKAI